MSNLPPAAESHERWLIFLVEWVLASAICGLILAAIIIAGPPGTPAWVIGLLIAINVTLGGVALIAMALTRRSSFRAASTGAQRRRSSSILARDRRHRIDDTPSSMRSGAAARRARHALSRAARRGFGPCGVAGGLTRPLEG